MKARRAMPETGSATGGGLIALPDARYLVALVPIGLFAFAPLLPSFYVTLLNNIGLAVLVVTGIVLLTGVAGMTTFGQAAFVGIGGYSTAWLATTSALPPWLAWAAGSPAAGLALGMAITLVLAAALGALTLRLSGHYLPLGTIAWGLSLYFLFGTLAPLGGHSGLANLPALRIGGFIFERGEQIFYPIWILVFAAMLLTRNLLDSRCGRAIRALNGGQIMAASMGVNVFRTKLTTFMLAAALASLAGWLYAYTQRFVSPQPFSVGAGVDYLFMALIGGVGHLWGALVGAMAFVLTKDLLQDWLPKVVGGTFDFGPIVFGLLIVALLQRSPAGVAGWIVAHRRRKRPTHAAELVPSTEAPPLPRRALPPPGTTLLEVRGLTRRFGGLLANQDIDLDVASGEILAIIGPNGAGKSTLFNQLSCCDTPTSGDVCLLGQSMRGWSADRAAAAGVARTFQHIKLLGEMSVLDNVAIGAHLRGHDGLLRCALRLDRAEEARLRGEARRQIERVGLGAHMSAEAGSLALGQQRLVEIARALACDPSLLLLDEPAAGLRHLEKQALADLLRRLRGEGIAVVLVEHDMDFVMNLADRVAVIVFGEKIVDDAPDIVRNDARVVEAYLGTEL